MSACHIVFQPKRKPNFNAHVMDYEGSLFPFQGKVNCKEGLVPMVGR
jgi:hypothetical protein